MCEQCTQLQEQVVGLTIQLGAAQERARRDAAVHEFQIQAMLENRRRERDLDSEKVTEAIQEQRRAERLKSLMEIQLDEAFHNHRKQAVELAKLRRKLAKLQPAKPKVSKEGKEGKKGKAAAQDGEVQP